MLSTATHQVLRTCMTCVAVFVVRIQATGSAKVAAVKPSKHAVTNAAGVLTCATSAWAVQGPGQA